MFRFTMFALVAVSALGLGAFAASQSKATPTGGCDCCPVCVEHGCSACPGCASGDCPNCVDCGACCAKK